MVGKIFIYLSNCNSENWHIISIHYIDFRQLFAQEKNHYFFSFLSYFWYFCRRFNKLFLIQNNINSTWQLQINEKMTCFLEKNLRKSQINCSSLILEWFELNLSFLYHFARKGVETFGQNYSKISNKSCSNTKRLWKKTKRMFKP